MPTYKTEQVVMSDGKIKATNTRINNPITGKLKEICNYAKLNRLGLIIGCDANAKSNLWGCDKEDDRGRNLEEVFASQDLHIINIDKEHKFLQGDRHSIIDITFVSKDMLDVVTKWRVDKSNSGSDHRYIQYEIENITSAGQETKEKRTGGSTEN